MSDRPYEGLPSSREGLFVLGDPDFHERALKSRSPGLVVRRRYEDVPTLATSRAVVYSMISMLGLQPTRCFPHAPHLDTARYSVPRRSPGRSAVRPRSARRDPETAGMTSPEHPLATYRSAPHRASPQRSGDLVPAYRSSSACARDSRSASGRHGLAAERRIRDPPGRGS